MPASITSHELVDEFNKMCGDPEEYQVDWASAERWNFNSTYDVKEFRTGEGGRPMLLLEGPQGGLWIVDSNPSGQPVVRNEKSGTEDRLSEITVYGEQFTWRKRIMNRIADVTGRTAQT